jgi:hypothetical protein
MAKVATGIGKSKRDLKAKIGKLAKFVKARKGEFSPKDKLVFKKALLNMSLAYKLLDKVECDQPEMSIPFGYSGSTGRSRKAGRAR